MTTALATAALAYANRLHWHVLPLEPGKKTPLGSLAPHGCHSASSDLSQVADWWRRAPMANVGLATGHGWFVLDVDPRSGGDETLVELQKIHGELPATVQATTGSFGSHYLFNLPECLHFTKTLGPGLDIKAHGGYIVACPSIHPNGNSYVWEFGNRPDERAIADAPFWMLAKLQMRAPSNVGLASGGAQDSFLAAVMEVAGYPVTGLRNGHAMVKCPWYDQHSDPTGDGNDPSTVILPPTAKRPLGTFYCRHGHCEGKGTVAVLKKVPSVALAAGGLKDKRLFVYACELLATHAGAEVAL